MDDLREPVPGGSDRGPAPMLSRRAIIEDVRPRVDDGRFPIKRTPGEVVAVRAAIFADGHDVLSAVVVDQSRGALRESELTLLEPGTDEWGGQFEVSAVGWHEYRIVAWPDRFRTWRHDLAVKAAVGQDVAVELLEGALLVREAAGRAEAQSAATGSAAADADAAALLAQADALSEPGPIADRVSAALDADLDRLMFTYADRQGASESATYRVWVDRERARFGAWYEMFPRSAGPDPARSGTFREAAERLAEIADLGFDVLYLPPIHPIGTSFRKGRNNALTAEPGDPGSPWAIGSAAGGHEAIDPGLGTLDDFLAFREEAERLGLEIALDLAWQCSPDHPWVREHPEWFRHRPDGTIKYAENPPKKYQDIYPFDFGTDDWRSLWGALLEVTRLWVERGVRIFRVDNPHTKSLGFWEWMIGEIRRDHPDVIFLSEAFTRPRLMQYLAKAGFTQSYTYFTWRNHKQELVEYFTELTTSPVREYLRPNLFANTPDILHAYLQHGGRPAFQARLLLAATLGASYGIYSGFELCENRAVRPGSEEYLDSEKYQYRKWDWNRPGHIKELIARVNRIRHSEPALQYDHTLRFHETDNPAIIAYSKRPPGAPGGPIVLTVVSLDPHVMQHGHVRVPRELLAELRVSDDDYVAVDLLDEIEYRWRGEWNYVRFDPDVRQGHILSIGSATT
jgi:starch synthase (maltosyl-transferring)